MEAKNPWSNCLLCCVGALENCHWEKGQGVWSSSFGREGGGSFQQLRHHLHPSCLSNSWGSQVAFQGCQPPGAPFATSAHRGCHQWQTTQSASTMTRLAVPAWHIVGWGRDAQLVPECTSCSRLPHQTAHNKPTWNTCRSTRLQAQLSVCSFCYWKHPYLWLALPG